MSARVVGMDEVFRKLKTLSANLQSENLVWAASAGAMIVQNLAKEKAPYITGTLRRSIHLQVGESGQSRAVINIGTDLEYAARIEFGFADTDSLGRVYNQSAQPYLRPALDEGKEKATADAKRALKFLVNRATR